MSESTERPGFTGFINQDGDYAGAHGFGFRFGSGAETERYGMIWAHGMSPLAVADALQKLALQMRTRTGTNGDQRLAGNEVNASEFRRLPRPATEMLYKEDL